MLILKNILPLQSVMSVVRKADSSTFNVNQIFVSICVVTGIGVGINNFTFIVGTGICIRFWVAKGI